MSIWWFIALVALCSGMVKAEKPHWGILLSVWVGFAWTIASMAFVLIFFPESFSS